MRRFLMLLLVSMGIAAVLCVYYAVRKFVFQGKVDVAEVGVLFVIAIAAFWLLAFKDWAQARSTRLERELDSLSTIHDELINLVRKNEDFSFIRCNATPTNPDLDYRWVIQCKTFDFNSALAKVKLNSGRRVDEQGLRKQLKADLKKTCGGGIFKPAVLGIVLETSDANAWSAKNLIDLNYAGGCGIAWLILLDESTRKLSSAHYPRPLRTTTFYDQFLSHFLASGYSQADLSAGAMFGDD